ncbi:MAG: type II toxin-antitoxin system prevent-host-death family antitoxin [Gammaproteobacteria bacterium]|nr:type II toxin-antitoxin system prevent-host-death family antitoxin [Gammaproteobacteria bacterium]
MKINATEFKAKCLKLVDEVARTREPIIVTKHGKPVAKVVPIEAEKPLSSFGYMAGTLKITGDIISPIDEEWSAITGDEDEFYTGMGVAKDKDEKTK